MGMTAGKKEWEDSWDPTSGADAETVLEKDRTNTAWEKLCANSRQVNRGILGAQGDNRLSVFTVPVSLKLARPQGLCLPKGCLDFSGLARGRWVSGLQGQVLNELSSNSQIGRQVLFAPLEWCNDWQSSPVPGVCPPWGALSWGMEQQRLLSVKSEAWLLGLILSPYPAFIY